jgi:DNA repair exonuclease SbcCD nuclease subunit
VRDMSLDLIIFNDLHLADKPPLGRKDGYREEGLAMLEELVGLANQHHALLISTGDLFHVKRPQHVSHALVQDVLKSLDGFNDLELRDPMFAVAGNHDMGPKGLDSIDSQPLGVLARAGVIRLIDGYERGGIYVGGRWLLIGRPYRMDRDADPSYYALTLEERARVEQQNNYFVLEVAHGSIVPPGEVRPYPTVSSNDIDMTGINLLVSGHIHEDLGIHPQPGVPLHIFANIGSLGRCSRTEANMTRCVKALGVTGKGSELTLNELPLKSALPAADIFVEHTVSDIDSDEIASVVAQLAATELGLESADFGDALNKLGLEQELYDKALRYLEEADSER